MTFKFKTICFFLIILIEFGYSSQCFSQIHIIPKVGVSQSMIVNNSENKDCQLLSYTEKFDYTSLILGFQINKQIGKNLFLNLSSNWKKGGSDAENSRPCTTHSGLIWVKSEYIEITSGLEYQFIDQFWINAGFYNGFLIKLERSEITYFGATVYDKTDIYKRVDQGIFIDVGWIWNKIRLGMNYQHGLTKIIENDMNRWISLNLGFQIDVTRN